MSNAYGNTNRDVRRFLRENGVKPTASNVELIGKEVRRSQSENERIVAEHKERGGPKLIDSKGRDAIARAKAQVQREIDARPIPKSRNQR